MENVSNSVSNVEGFLQNTTIVDIIVIIAIVAIIAFLVKKAVGIALGVVAIFLLFNIGFLATGEDVNNSNIGDYVEPSLVTTIANFFDDFEARRNEHAVVDADAVYEDMKDVANTGAEMLASLLTKENIEKLAASIETALLDAGVEEISLDELIQILAEKYEASVDSPEIQAMAESILEEMENVTEATE